MLPPWALLRVKLETSLHELETDLKRGTEIAPGLFKLRLGGAAESLWVSSSANPIALRSATQRQHLAQNPIALRCATPALSTKPPDNDLCVQSL